MTDEKTPAHPEQAYADITATVAIPGRFGDWLAACGFATGDDVSRADEYYAWQAWRNVTVHGRGRAHEYRVTGTSRVFSYLFTRADQFVQQVRDGGFEFEQAEFSGAEKTRDRCLTAAGALVEKEIEFSRAALRAFMDTSDRGAAAGYISGWSVGLGNGQIAGVSRKSLEAIWEGGAPAEAIAEARTFMKAVETHRNDTPGQLFPPYENRTGLRTADLQTMLWWAGLPR